AARAGVGDARRAIDLAVITGGAVRVPAAEPGLLTDAVARAVTARGAIRVIGARIVRVRRAEVSLPLAAVAVADVIAIGGAVGPAVATAAAVAEVQLA